MRALELTRSNKVPARESKANTTNSISHARARTEVTLVMRYYVYYPAALSANIDVCVRARDVFARERKDPSDMCRREIQSRDSRGGCAYTNITTITITTTTANPIIRIERLKPVKLEAVVCMLCTLENALSLVP